MSSVLITIGSQVFPARLEHELAPQSCIRLERLLPYRGQLIQARWSGDACWSPIGAAWPSEVILPAENAAHTPEIGQVLLYAGAVSEPEFYVPYGFNRFAWSGGPLAGNPVLTLTDGADRLPELGREILWRGAADFTIALQP